MDEVVKMYPGSPGEAWQTPCHPKVASSIPPRIEEVKIYFSQKGVSGREIEDFFIFYEERQWTSKGKSFKNWKSVAYRWIARIWKKDPLSFDMHNR